jgi:integrase
MPLTDALARSAKPRDGKLTKLSDGAGLQLWIHPSGKRTWHLAYRCAGTQRSLTLGAYPEVSLREAREKARAARVELDAGKDPSGRTNASVPTTFGAVAAQWLAKLERDARSEPTIERARRMIRRAVALHGRPITAIKPPELVELLRPIEEAGHLETVVRLRSAISSVFRFAAAMGLVESDPASLLRGAFAAPKAAHRAAILDRSAFGELLRAIDAYQGRGPLVSAALKLLALTAARPGELRLATWAEFDLDAAVWTVPAGRMKMRQPHRAPLARQAVEILRDLKESEIFFANFPVSESPISNFAFPGLRPGRPLSENSFNVALRSMGFPSGVVSSHGFRATFSSLANESGLWSYDAIERALAHTDGSNVRRAYARTDWFEERRRLMQWYADQVDEMRVS